MVALHDRIRQRLAETGKSARHAALSGGLSGDAIYKILKKTEQSQTLETIRKLAIGLETTPQWLAYGIVGEAAEPDSSLLIIKREFLAGTVASLLKRAGVDTDQADAWAETFLEALAGPGIDEVGGDAQSSFRIHLQLAEQRRSAGPKPRQDAR